MHLLFHFLSSFKNIHKAGHSNRYFLDDPVPVLDFQLNLRLQQVYIVDDDGGITILGTGSAKEYRYTPSTQYFTHDADHLDDRSRIPYDIITHQRAEDLPIGLLLDYLRAPYQYQQLDGTVSTQQYLQLREQEVARNNKRLEEIAQEERQMHNQNEVALQGLDNQDILDEVEEGEAIEEGDNDEFRIDLSEENESDDDVDEESDDDDGLYDDETQQVTTVRRRVIPSDDESTVSRSTRQSRTSHPTQRDQTDLYNRPYRTTHRRERRERREQNDIVRRIERI